MLVDYVFHKNKLEGRLENFTHVKGMHIHVFTSSKKYIQLDEQLDQIIEIDTNDIIKITYSKPDKTKTTLAILSSIVIIGPLVYALSWEPLFVIH